MLTLIAIIVYVALGVAILLLCQRIRPDWFFDPDLNADGGKRWRPDSIPGPQWAFVPLFWPAAIVVLLGAIATSANLRAMNNGLRLRAELEKDLAVARKEIDDMLRKEAPHA